MDPDNSHVYRASGHAQCGCCRQAHRSSSKGWHPVSRCACSVLLTPGWCAGGKVTYAYRPALLPNCTSLPEGSCSLAGAGDRLQLPGWGVELAVKNMEYSALDDAKVLGWPGCNTLWQAASASARHTCVLSSAALLRRSCVHRVNPHLGRSVWCRERASAGLALPDEASSA